MIKGMLANYENQANNFERGTSITRTDTGNGACETVYVTDFSIVKKGQQVLASRLSDRAVPDRCVSVVFCRYAYGPTGQEALWIKAVNR